MKKIDTLLLAAAVVVIATLTYHLVRNSDDTFFQNANAPMPTTKYGDFLAAQHAISINDFARAAEFTEHLPTEYRTVASTKILAEFLSGKMPSDAGLLAGEKNLQAELIYGTYLLMNDRWDDFYKLHKSDTGVLTAPLRIWGAVATKHTDEALKWLDQLPGSGTWKTFIRGQIYAETGDTAKAATEFVAVDPKFMNLGDYMYVMSFYRAHDMADAADQLRADYTGEPGGMFLMDYDYVPDWSVYSGLKNALAFSLIQNVSHTPMITYSDFSILLLRMAQLIAPSVGEQMGAIDYYIGQYFFNDGGDYMKYFSRVPHDSPFYPFVVFRHAEKTNDVAAARRILRDYPLFVPAMNFVFKHHVMNGERRAALRILNTATTDERLNDTLHAFVLKSRARVNYMFGDLDAAAADLHAAADVLGMDMEIMALQVYIWVAQNRELDNAYKYAMTMVQGAPADLLGWDVLARVVAAREGVDAALDVLDRVGDVANDCSSLFEELGDLWAAKGDKKRAAAAYNRALELSDDGLVVIPQIKKKLRKVK